MYPLHSRGLGSLDRVGTRPFTREVLVPDRGLMAEVDESRDLRDGGAGTPVLGGGVLNG